MSTLLPVHSAAHIHEGITEYLTTSFSLADKSTAAQLASFLTDPNNGMFRGPYVRTRLPYAPASSWEGLLDWLPEWFIPYKHQAEAFKRLASRSDEGPKRPDPTLVVTGTGSGKTESFLFPILDHCVRSKGEGVKALILYPMNALANDQAKRLASLICNEHSLGSITAGIYTGESKASRNTRMTKDSLITDPDYIRDCPPDILLTNYKMLDQLLLRAADRKIWEKSAQSLQYLVLDEFHTYDGAQGTDVSLLLRRLGLMLKRFQPDGWLSDVAEKRVLGNVTPVATSATLGSEGDPTEMLDFASKVFGEDFLDGSIITETALTLQQWQQMIASNFGDVTSPPKSVEPSALSTVNDDISNQVENLAVEYSLAVHKSFCEDVFDCPPGDVNAVIAHAAKHPLVEKILNNAHKSAIPLMHRGESEPSTLLELVFEPSILRQHRASAEKFLAHLLAELSYLRSEFGKSDSRQGKQFPSVELHLWVRELSRVDRSLTPVVEGYNFRWADDGPQDDADPQSVVWLPACYCRNCGRSGWMVSMQPGGDAPIISSSKIRSRSLTARASQRPLLETTFEVGATNSTADHSQVLWFNFDTPSLGHVEPSDQAKEAGRAIPVLTYAGDNQEKLAEDQVCPSCGERDAIRFLGASVSTLLSVALSNLFGQSDLDEAEKKTLVFTDSVQDAAHRAGFVQYRARAFALRAFIKGVVQDQQLSLAEIPQLLVDMSSDDARTRFDLLPPDLTDYPDYKEFWDSKSEGLSSKTRTLVAPRLGIDVTLEFGQRAMLARSLTSTGALTVMVGAEDSKLINAALNATTDITLGLSTDDTILNSWARSVIEEIRLHGGIHHPWFESYIHDDCNSYQLNKRSARTDGMPRFPRGGTPKFPLVVGSRSSKRQFDDGSMNIGPRSYYAQLTARILGISTHDAALAVKLLLSELAEVNVLHKTTTNSGSIVYSIDPKRVLVRAEENPEALECETCHAALNLDPLAREVLKNTPCHSLGCSGTLRVVPIEDNYYQRLYASTQPRTVIAQEHTSLLENEERLAIETQFKAKRTSAPNAPNVLVATPTLEMGIDIGDLSTVVLSSIPQTVANYVQRVGRAGRLTGNSLILALARGRGKSLPHLTKPLKMIAGSVHPPVAFLSAEEILHRQFLAFVIEQRGLDADLPKHLTANGVFGGFGDRPNLVKAIEDSVADGIESLLEQFNDSLGDYVSEEVTAELYAWSTGIDENNSLLQALRRARETWASDRESLLKRINELEQRFADLRRLAESTSADEDIRDQLRTTRASFRHARLQSDKLNNEYWISAMERYGLLPNYTLLDDTVELNLSITRQQPGTLEFETERREYSRGVSSALFELAPGSTFYAQGIAAKIDSVEIGEHGSNIEHWQFCPSCSYSTKLSGEPNARGAGVCPICGDARFSDRNQVIPVLPLRKSSAQVDHSRSAISDAIDDRARVQYHSAFSAVVDPQGIGDSWYLDSGFGLQYLRRASLHWLNLGRGAGDRRVLGGVEVETPLFQVCRHCGHIDSEAGTNRWQDHQAWCEYRNKTEEDTVSFALGRTLTTQGIFMLLPKLLTVADSLTLPSLIAALRLGFKEVLGGDPAHLDVIQAVFGHKNPDSGDAAEPTQGLLLHDRVPGGTGYLAQFTNPKQVRQLFLKAWERVSDCNCKDDDLLCCENCLLPYTGPRSLESTSRAAAEVALFKLLANDLHPSDDVDVYATEWVPQTARPKVDNRSHLEALFFHELRTSLEERDVKLKERVRGGGTEWEFTFPGSKRSWRMQEQKDLGSTVPDFYFSTEDSNVPDLALYLDGASYHISEEHKRLHGDVEKRNGLFDNNIQPWSLTWRDVENHGKQRELPVDTQPRWFIPNLQAGLAEQLNLERAKIDLLVKDPLTQLLAWLNDPNSVTWEKIARAAALHAAMNGREFDGVNIRSTTLAPLTVTYSTSILQSDLLFDTSRGIELETWNEFLILANLFYARKSQVSVHTDVTAKHAVEKSLGIPAAEEEISVEWQEIRDEFTGEEDAIECILALALGKVRVPDSYGAEVFGIASIAVWEGPKIALVFERDAVLEKPLMTDAWTIVSPEDFNSDQLPDAFAILKEHA